MALFHSQLLSPISFMPQEDRPFRTASHFSRLERNEKGRIGIVLYLLLGHDLFGKPVSTPTCAGAGFFRIMFR
jgi:hypothetical protein